MSCQTYTVVAAFVTGDGQYRVCVRGHHMSLLADESIKEGDAVVIVGDRAERAK